MDRVKVGQTEIPFYFFIFLFSSLLLISCHSTEQKDKQGITAQTNAAVLKTGPNRGETPAPYPITLKNDGREITFDKPPKRIIPLMQQDAELLLALGLKDKIVGYSLISDYTPDPYKQQLKDIPVLSEDIPSKEVIFNKDPDLIIGSETSFLDNAVGTRDRLNELGIHTYVAKANHPATIDNQVYQQIRDMAQIFDAPSQGEQVIGHMQNRIDSITDQLGTIDNPVKAVYLAGGKGGTLQAAGGDSLDSYLMELAGGKNIFEELDGYLVQVSWEEIVARDPDVIVISYCCGGNPDDLEDLIKTKSSLQGVSAVKHQRFVPVRVEETTGSMRIPTGLKKLAQGFYPDRFATE